MSTMDAEQEVTQLIAARLGVPMDRVTPDAELVGDLGADSLALAELAVDLERRTGRRISPDALFDVCTVGDLLHALD